MKRITWITLTLVMPVVALLATSATELFAGPPLLCHPIEIGDAHSLPWGNGAWDNGKVTSNDDEFVTQVLDLLSPTATVLTRMETIRRAAIHGAESPASIRQILNALHERIQSAGATQKPDPLSMFDYGYMLATCAQMNEVTDFKSTGVSGKPRKALTIDESVNPYDLVLKAARATGSNPEIEFALALMTSYATQAESKLHLQNAVIGATEGSLLATNLVRHFGRNGQSLADLRTSYGIVTDGEHR